MSLFSDRRLPAELIPRSRTEELEIGSPSELPPGSVVGVGDYAVVNHDGKYFAVSRSCRHLLGDLAEGTLDRKGCLVCPVHGARYDLRTGRMVRGPQGIYAQIPGSEAALKLITRVVPLRRREVVESDGRLFLR